MDKTEEPLDNKVGGYSNTAIFRSIAFIGDSLSSGEFEITNSEGVREYHDLYEYSWGQYIARRNGIKAYNFSRGGMTAKWYIESYADEKNFWDKDKACQAYVIALGVNDLCNQNMDLGSIKDINEQDYHKSKKTFAGYYSQIISRYKEISPDAKFFLVGLPKLQDERHNKIAEKMNSLLEDFTNYFKNTYFINLYKYVPCYDDDFKKQYYLNGHMNPMGYIYTAEIIDSYIDFIIRHNAPDFRYVGLINSGIKYVK
ncbi:MAG: SGNH/GDSL hydrolase family protein [Clostridia bacterium]|nr:SGNH/GDSL hydrolase family protein [Clostridia bacterium]